MTQRELEQTIPSVPTSDGAGVRLRRSLGQGGNRLDPFLMLDEFGTDRPEDYLAGFPAHPHRGFETVTYMLDGHMRHQDHLGNVGELTEGGVQWMTAGRGIIHSEMPQQRSGRMRGFQLWINLPAAEKMKPAGYRDIPADQIPLVKADGVTVKVIAGELSLAGQSVAGPIAGLTTQPLFYDVWLEPDAQLQLALPAAHNGFVYAYEGVVEVGAGRQKLPQHAAGILTLGEQLSLAAGAAPARTLVLAGKPLAEPVVQHGPFVMNTREQIEQAVADYRNGTLTENAAVNLGQASE